MGKRKRDNLPAPTIWEIPDDVWPMLQRIMDEHDPAKPKRQRRVDLRRMFNGIIFRLRPGCQRNRLPGALGDDRPVHRHFQHWGQLGICTRLWTALVDTCQELHGVDWPWQAADAAMGQARMGGDLGGRNPPERGNKG
jgi:putative transposase